MQRYRIGCAAVFAGMAARALALSVSANSSWVWLSETRPLDLLPAVIVLTLAIEITAVLFALKKRNFRKVLLVVTLANLLSFAAPYLFNYLRYTMNGFSYRMYLEHWPSYIVGTVYLAVTLVIELPVVWLSLRKDTDYPGRFALVILLANAVTTGLTVLAEELFCSGRW